MAKKCMFLFSVLFFFSSCVYGTAVVFACVIGMFICYSVNNRGQISITGVINTSNICFYLFCLLSLLSVGWAVKSSYSLEMGIRLIEIAFFYFVFFMCYKDEKVDSLLKVIMYGGYLVSLYIVIQTGFGKVVELVSSAQRISYHDSDFNANSIGMYAAFSIIINFFYIIYNKEILKIRNLFLIPGLLALLVSQSRKCILVVILAVIMLLFTYNFQANSQKGFLKTVFRTALLICFLVVIFSILNDSVIFSLFNSRMGEIFDALNGKSSDATVRLLMIKSGFKAFLQSPLLGNGIDNGRVFGLAATGFDAYLHNNYIEILAGLGIFGFILYYYIFFDTAKTIIRFRYKRDKYMDVILALLIARLILEFGQVTYYGKDNLMFLTLFSLESYNIKQGMVSTTSENGTEIL